MFYIFPALLSKLLIFRVNLRLYFQNIILKVLTNLFRVEAAVQVLEASRVEIEVAQILKQISSSNIKTIKGSIDERHALTRALEQNPETFYPKNVQNNDLRYGLVKNKAKNVNTTTSSPSKPEFTKKTF